MKKRSTKSRKKASSLKSLNNALIMDYPDLRKVFFAAGNPAAARGKPPTRPPRLDKRLPAAHLKDLALHGHRGHKKSSRGFDAYFAVLDSIREELAKIDKKHDWYELLSPARRTVLLADTLEAEVNNGGFDQYFLNSSGDGAYLAPDALKSLGLKDIARMLESANSQFPRGPSAARKARLAQMEKLPQSATDAFEKLNDKFFSRKGPSATDTCVKFIRDNPAEFFKV